MSLGEEARKQIRRDSAEAERCKREAHQKRIQGRACLESLVSEFLKEVAGPPKCAYTAEVTQEVQGWFKKRIIREYGWSVLVKTGIYEQERLIILESGFWGFARSGSFSNSVYCISKEDVSELPNLTSIDSPHHARLYFVKELKDLLQKGR